MAGILDRRPTVNGSPLDVGAVLSLESHEHLVSSSAHARANGTNGNR
jgi:hypothetical protein